MLEQAESPELLVRIGIPKRGEAQSTQALVMRNLGCAKHNNNPNEIGPVLQIKQAHF